VIKRALVTASVAGVFLASLFAAAAASASPHVYVTGYTSDELQIFDVGADGTLTARPGPLAPGDGPEAIAFAPDGRFLFVTNLDSDTIRPYSVAPDGSLTAAEPVPTGADDNPYGATVSPDGRFLYVALYNPDRVKGYAIAENGLLTALPGPTTPTVDNTEGIVMSPDGTHLYTAGGGNQIGAFNVAADGALTPVAGQPLPAGAGTYVLSTSPDGRFLFAPAFQDDVIHVFTIGADGGLTPVEGSPFPGDSGYASAVVSPGGDRLYMTNYDDSSISAFSISPAGALAPIGTPLEMSINATGAAITPDGRYLYATAFEALTDIYEFSVAADGALSLLPGSPIESAIDDADFESLAINPAQPPEASFRLALNGKKAKLNASESVDIDGTVASYAWDFGDGETATTTSPKTTHKFKGKPGAVTLTVTDDEGCSSQLVYTGQDTLCNGGPIATFSSAGIAGAKAKAKKEQEQGKTLLVEVKLKAKEAATAKVKGKVLPQRGRPVGLAAATKKLKPGKARTLKLKAKKAAAGERLVDQLGGKRTAKAQLKVTLSDAAGDSWKGKATAKLVG
jgi:6-phosphogluconolactonase (cycloisomerase 2 family)